MNYFKVIYDLISPHIGPDVYPLDAYQQQALPYVIIDINSVDPIDGKLSRTKGHEVDFSIIVMDNDADRAQATATTALNVLDKYCGGQMLSCNMLNTIFIYDTVSRAYQQNTTYYSRMLLDLPNYSVLHYSRTNYSTQ